MKPRVRYGMLAVAAALLIAVFVDMARSVTQRPSLKNMNLTGTLYRGGNWSLAEHRGKRPVLLSFFATWCGPCRMEYPHLVELQEKLGSEKVEIVLLTEEDSTTLDQDRDYSRSPLKILTGAQDVFTAFNVSPIPRTILINVEGDIQMDVSGYSENSMAEIKKILSNP